MTILNFGQFIAIRREALKMNKAEAARRMNVSPQILANWEKGMSYPKDKSLERLSKTYEISIAELQEMMTQIKEDKAPKKTASKAGSQKVNVSYILRKIDALRKNIEKEMSGESTFEKNIKAKSLASIERAREILEGVKIVDETF